MTVRFFIRWEDGTIEFDETTPVAEYSHIEQIAKGFSALGRRGEIVVEFDPPLAIPRLACG